MKKRKTYEISVIDKTYSKTISDETKFYTSDTALELVFKLKETEYAFESAEIVLLNIDDRSLVTRPVAKVLDSFTYELGDDIIAHYGEWRGQLRFEQAGETYVSSPVKFRIDNDLSSDRPPQLSDVQSWVSLKRYADSLVDELKQAVMSIEGIEDTFNENETVRQSQFETAEQSRQTTFEMAESERDETFNTNEDIRQIQELEREKAEATRQSEFEDNEASRDETFNTNEATRQENERTRQQAESQRQSTFETNETERQTTFETAEQERQSAELIRVSAEEQRKTDHANRSAELEGKADKVVIENLIANGDFSDGLNGWGIYGLTNANSTRTIVDDPVSSGGYCLKIYRDNDQTGGFGRRQSFSFNGSSKIYVRVGMLRLSTDGLTSLVPIFFTENPITSNAGRNDIYDNWQYVSNVVDKTSIDTPLYINLAPNVNNDGLTTYYDDVMLINLTETFGTGNEPTKEEMDELIKITGYIDGEYALNNKEMLIWTLALIRRNKNAIIELGGA